MLVTRATCFLLVVGVAYWTNTVDAHPPRKPEAYARSYYRNPRNCDHCPPGWGVVTMCNRTHLTVCSPCTDDTWSSDYPHLNRCLPCAKCGDGSYVEYKCRPTKDTVCGWCHTHKGFLSEDYKRKCGSVDTSGDEYQDWLANDKVQEEEKRNEENVGVPDDGDLQHEFWQFDKRNRGPLDITDEQRISVKPSYHEYEADPSSTFSDRVRKMRMDAYRQRAYILFGFAAILMLVAVIFFVWLLRECRRPMHRVIPGRQKLYVHLTEQDNEIIRQCANSLRRNGKLRSISDLSADNEEDYWEEPMHLTENPLERFMAFGSTEQLLPKAKC